eukprot:scaffold55394_cov48-Phaeocystis_antarctica.AAC.1
MPPVLVPLVRRGLRGPSRQHGPCTRRRALRRGRGRTGEATQVQGRRLGYPSPDLGLAVRYRRAEGALRLAPLVEVRVRVRVGTGLRLGPGPGLGLGSGPGLGPGPGSGLGLGLGLGTPPGR